MTNEEITYDIFRRCLAATVTAMYSTGMTAHTPQGSVDAATHLTKLALERLTEFGIVTLAKPKDDASLITEIIHAVYGIEISQTLAEHFITHKDHFFRNRNLYQFTQEGIETLSLYAIASGQKLTDSRTVLK
jgi:hypothetical protein